MTLQELFESDDSGLLDSNIEVVNYKGCTITVNPDAIHKFTVREQHGWLSLESNNETVESCKSWIDKFHDKGTK
jgi:hypothetical protein